MKRLHQELDTNTDAFSYTVIGEDKPLYRVDSSGYLFKNDVQIGKFKLRSEQWQLWLGDDHYMDGPVNGLFGLPEFELKALTALVNQ